MDLYVERQCIEEMKKGDLRKFMMLFDACYEDLYRYVSRRVYDKREREKIVRLTFLDALGQVQSTPMDTGFLIWLYSLARPRVWDFIAATSKKGQQDIVGGGESEDQTKVFNMLQKLSLEEREIFRLKFFEQVADGDVMVILGVEEGAIGTKIYRVLKRAHFLLFGESDNTKQVYFGELSGLFEKIRREESIRIDEVLKLQIKTDLMSRIDKKDFAIKGEVVKEEVKPAPKVEAKSEAKGSDDPAKIFVQAVKEMREEEALESERLKKKLEKKEGFYDFIDRWKTALAIIPVVIFVGVVAVVLMNVMDYLGQNKNSCKIEVAYDEELSVEEKDRLRLEVSNRICDHYEVSEMEIEKEDDKYVAVSVDVEGWKINYRFTDLAGKWRVQYYARTVDSDKKPRKVS